MQAPNTKSLAAEDMLRVKDIAKFFKVHPSTIYRAIQAKELFAHRVGGKKRGPLRVPQCPRSRRTASPARSVRLTRPKR